MRFHQDCHHRDHRVNIKLGVVVRGQHYSGGGRDHRKASDVRETYEKISCASKREASGKSNIPPNFKDVLLALMSHVDWAISTTTVTTPNKSRP